MKEYKINPTDFNISEIIEEFKEHGFNVTEEALLHNYNAWKDDFKSGYADPTNGFHLFTPCGCNPLSFRCSEFINADWQTTYIA